MSVFTMFLICWCTGAVFFPLASAVSAYTPVEKTDKSEKKIEVENLINNVDTAETVFLNDFNKKEIFTLNGDYSGRQIVDYNGETYLVYFEKVEGSRIFMCAKNVSKKLPEPSIDFSKKQDEILNLQN